MCCMWFSNNMMEVIILGDAITEKTAQASQVWHVQDWTRGSGNWNILTCTETNLHTHARTMFSSTEQIFIWTRMARFGWRDTEWKCLTFGDCLTLWTVRKPWIWQPGCHGNQHWVSCVGPQCSDWSQCHFGSFCAHFGHCFILCCFPYVVLHLKSGLVV